jgi:hypothetical protein
MKAMRDHEQSEWIAGPKKKTAASSHHSVSPPGAFCFFMSKLGKTEKNGNGKRKFLEGVCADPKLHPRKLAAGRGLRGV